MADDFRRLDTLNFQGTISAYDRHIEQYHDIVQGVNKAAETLVDNWEGEGRNAFREDYTQVQLNLKDISDIMNEIRAALNAAKENYSSADQELANAYSGESGE